MMRRAGKDAEELSSDYLQSRSGLTSMRKENRGEPKVFFTPP